MLSANWRMVWKIDFEVPKKYDGLMVQSLQFPNLCRMAVVVAAEDVARFKELAYAENLEATVAAKVTEKPYLVMHWNGKEIVNISCAFWIQRRRKKHIDITPMQLKPFASKFYRFQEGISGIGAGFERMPKESGFPNASTPPSAQVRF